MLPTSFIDIPGSVFFLPTPALARFLFDMHASRLDRGRQMRADSAFDRSRHAAL